ncbi:heme ABC transporter ATP-binding protein [Embleya sp. NBC_00888]|uniref:heme ABC transporter ATP-binding protein n=1 Tax=Embleya sp. NBC_00888 TaxID=2975960 RepID=UPI003870A44E|nr:heme ABC transporter ATP-binding protein [Embleya sp. NBC_00888]
MRLLARNRGAAPAPTPESGAIGVEAEDVSFGVAGRNLVDGVSLNVRHGEIVAVLGPNGAGKSTLLGLLTGDLTPHQGTVRIADRPLPAYSQRELALRRAVLPQNVTLSFPFTVDEVVRMGRAPHAGLPSEESEDAIVARCLAETDVAHLADRAYPSLSGGERARVSLARVLAQGAPVLFLDEPTAALDLKHTEDVLRLARARARRGHAVVIVLHDLNLAAAYADRIALLAGGRLVACGPPDRVCTAPVLSDLYGHPVDVLRRPGSDELLILPSR